MATFNATNPVNVLSSSLAAAAVEHFERNSAAAAFGNVGASTTTTTTAYLVPSSNGTPLQLQPFASNSNFINSSNSLNSPNHHSHHQQQHPHNQQHQSSHHHTNQNSSSTSSYTFVQIKSEPCQVSEITSNCHQQQQQRLNPNNSNSLSSSSSISSSSSSLSAATHHHHHSSSTTLGSVSSSSKTMSSSTLTTLVKIEASSPKVPDMEKSQTINSLNGTASSSSSSSNNSVPIGIAVARKRTQETTSSTSNTSSSLSSSLCNPNTMSLQPQNLNKDLNCFGLRVADLGGVGAGCGNIYFTGAGDLMTSTATAEELALSAAGVQSVNRASSTFWQYPNALPIESVISMSPATVGLQYTREASRGQVVLLPATPALDPFQQAALVWPSYIPQSNTSAAAAAAAALQPPPNFIFPSMNSHSTLQAAQPYATSLQLFGSNYFTAAAAAAAAAAATSSLCQHNQQTNTSATNSINLSIGPTGVGTTSSSTTCSSTSSRFLSLTPASVSSAELTKHQAKASSLSSSALAAASSSAASSLSSSSTTTTTLSLPAPPSPSPISVPTPLIVPPTSMKIEEWNATEYMSAAGKTTTTTIAAHQHSNVLPHGTANMGSSLPPPPPPLALIETRDKTTTTTTTNLLELQAQALNLMRIPTPPTSATIETAAAAAATSHLQSQLVFQAAATAAAMAASSPTPTLLNLSTTNLPRAASVNPNFGPPTPLGDDMALNFKTTSLESTPSQIVVGVPRVLPVNAHANNGPPPQMQDVNIQTDTPICSEDENSSCALTLQQQTSITGAPGTPPPEPANSLLATYDNDNDTQEPLELTTHHANVEENIYKNPINQCHTNINNNNINNNINNINNTINNINNSMNNNNNMNINNNINNMNINNNINNMNINNNINNMNINNNINNNHNLNNNMNINNKNNFEDKQVQSNNSNLIAAATASINEKPSAEELIKAKQECLINPFQVRVKSPESFNTINQERNSDEFNGLELLSNISTSNLVDSNSTATTASVVESNNQESRPPLVRIKEEPLDDMCNDSQGPTNSNDHFESSSFIRNPSPSVDNHNETISAASASSSPSNPTTQQHNQTNVVEQYGGLSLLCALAEQRIQEEVQSATNNGLLTTAAAAAAAAIAGVTPVVTIATAINQTETKLTFSFASAKTLQQTQTSLVSPFTSSVTSLEQNSFPSMDGIELPSTSCLGSLNELIKKKKHKHSKSSKSSKKSHNGCSKKSKKKLAKEKRKHKLSSAPEDLDLDDEQFQEEFQNALQNLDPSYTQWSNGQWPDAQKIFNVMENSMKQRLAKITRQYRKKKRKLEEINKNKKKKKCSKLLIQQQQQQQQEQQQQQLQQPQQQLLQQNQQPPQIQSLQTTSSLSLSGSSVLALHANANSCLGSASSSPLCEYKFSKFAKVGTTSTTGTSHSSLIQPSSFLRFAEKTQPSFPPSDLDFKDNDQDRSSSTPLSSTGIFKPVRLEPSALAQAEKQRQNEALRLTKKHPSPSATNPKSQGRPKKAKKATKKRQAIIKTNPIATAGADASALASASTAAISAANEDEDIVDENHDEEEDSAATASFSQCQILNPMDRELMLTSEHLYREETRVLTEMGGLFYAGIMKPLQPPDVYAITLDGERGNKSHIMSREEIFEDTILEVTPKSVESLPIGTRLCAYWSQQYRCLYPGRVIESESSDDGTGTNDFVSVEFDDGDSGRIRLQNIRLLLSDYPIAEYNDNPFYVLGKQKKNKSQAGNCNLIPPPVTPLSSSCKQLSKQHLYMTGESYASSLNNSTEMFARRTEKKRSKKSLKRKSQMEKQSLTLSMPTTSSTTLTSTLSPTKIPSTTITISNNKGFIAKSGNTNMSEEMIDKDQKKHHKHKKHKKHKKHHHRKNNLDTDGDSSNNITYMVKPLPMPYKREVCMDGEDGPPNATTNYNHNHSNEGQSLLLKRTQSVQGTGLNGGGAIIKTEASPNDCDDDLTTSQATVAATIKVKTENIDMEEETTSNLMSEISDEIKNDEIVEHNNSKGSSKIAAFLPERQLWGWFGTAYRKAGQKGRARKQFYKTIKRGKETISVGDSAVFLSTGRPDRPYIGRIESMWETTAGNKVVRVRWFYHPEETTGCPELKYPGALFESPHEDENDVQTISHRCEVLQFIKYFGKFGADSKQYQSIYDNNDTYYLAGHYNPRLKILKLQDDIPTLQEQNTITNTNTNTYNTNTNTNTNTNSNANVINNNKNKINNNNN